MFMRKAIPPKLRRVRIFCGAEHMPNRHMLVIMPYDGVLSDKSVPIQAQDTLYIIWLWRIGFQPIFFIFV